MSGRVEIPPLAQNLFMQLQQLKAQLEASMRQKMQVEAIVRDIENALKELEKSDQNSVIYKNVGQLMIKANKDNVREDLAEKKETYNLRLKTLERQEERSQRRYQQLQQQLQESLGTVKAQTAAT